MAVDSENDDPHNAFDEDGGPNSTDLLPVERHAASTVFADAAVVEVIGETIQLSFIERARGLSRAEWSKELTQPSRVALFDTASEVARIRITRDSANDIALNILLELAQAGGFQSDTFDRNIAIIRDAVNALSEPVE